MYIIHTCWVHLFHYSNDLYITWNCFWHFPAISLWQLYCVNIYYIDRLLKLGITSYNTESYRESLLSV